MPIVSLAQLYNCFFAQQIKPLAHFKAMIDKKAHKNTLKILKQKFPKKLRNLVIEESSGESESEQQEEHSWSKFSKTVSAKTVAQCMYDV